MDDLIANMAEIMLEENKKRVGEEYAEIAIEEIEKERQEKGEDKKEGGNKNVQEKKTRGRPKKSK